jgi:hypothetical protein
VTFTVWVTIMGLSSSMILALIIVLALKAQPSCSIVTVSGAAGFGLALAYLIVAVTFELTDLCTRTWIRAYIVARVNLGPGGAI